MNSIRKIIESSQLSASKKAIFLKLADFFDENMPESLYLDYYQLADALPGSTPDLWEELLDLPDVQKFRNNKIAKLMKFKAVQALKQLEEASVQNKAGQVQAINQLIEKSDLISANNSKRETYIISYMPPKEVV